MSYRSGIRRYLAFCRRFALSPLPLSDNSLCRFVAALHADCLSPSSIRLYLSSLRFFQICLGNSVPDPVNFPRLHYVLRAVQRCNPRYRRAPRLPITPAILRHLYSAWSQSPVPYEHHMWWAACCLGFFAFLRAGEFTCPSRQAYTTTMLSPRDIQVDNREHPTYLSVTLRQSKTDAFGAGITLYIGTTGDHICPVSAVLAYLAIRPPVTGPLFVHADGRPLSRVDLVVVVRRALSTTGLDVTRFSGHSFRIGAASAAAQVGIPDSLIQTLGRWKSSAFLLYIRTPPSQLTAISRRLLLGQSLSTNVV